MISNFDYPRSDGHPRRAGRERQGRARRRAAPARHAVLRNALSNDVREELVSRNPAKLVTIVER
jgi:hypothetical protein